MLVASQATLRSALSGALTLRRWGLGVLAGRSAVEFPATSVRSVGLFLEAERCAHRLDSQLARLKMFGGLPGRFTDFFAERVRAEAARIDAARAHLSTLSDLALRLGFTIVSSARSLWWYS